MTYYPRTITLEALEKRRYTLAIWDTFLNHNFSEDVLISGGTLELLAK